jgi:hypothetical protein
VFRGRNTGKRLHDRSNHGRMPELTRRRSLDAPAGTSIMVTCASARSRSAPASRLAKIRGAGIAGSIPAAICIQGTAATFDQARADFETAWRLFLSNRTPIFRSGARSGIGPRENMPCGNEANGWRPRDPVPSCAAPAVRCSIVTGLNRPKFTSRTSAPRLDAARRNPIQRHQLKCVAPRSGPVGSDAGPLASNFPGGPVRCPGFGNESTAFVLNPGVELRHA